MRAYNKSFLKFGKDGISFSFRGTEVTWIFPWKRKHFGSAFYSGFLDDHYGSFSEIHEDMDKYLGHCHKAFKR